MAKRQITELDKQVLHALEDEVENYIDTYDHLPADLKGTATELSKEYAIEVVESELKDVDFKTFDFGGFQFTIDYRLTTLLHVLKKYEKLCGIGKARQRVFALQAS